MDGHTTGEVTHTVTHRHTISLHIFFQRPQCNCFSVKLATSSSAYPCTIDTFCFAACRPRPAVEKIFIFIRIFVFIFVLKIFVIMIFELGLIVFHNHVHLTLRLLRENLAILGKGFECILSCAHGEGLEAQVAAYAAVAAAVTEVAPERAARATVTAAHANSAHAPTTTTVVPGAATTGPRAATAAAGATAAGAAAARAATALPRLSCDHLSLLLNIRFVSDEIGSLVSHSSEDSSKALDGFRDGDGRFLREDAGNSAEQHYNDGGQELEFHGC